MIFAWEKDKQPATVLTEMEKHFIGISDPFRVGVWVGTVYPGLMAFSHQPGADIYLPFRQKT